jgi:phosphate transport system substrate-binding protein
MKRPRRWLALGLVGALVASDGYALEIRSQQLEDKSLEIRGSGSVLPLAEKVAELYMKDHPDTIVVVSPSNNRRGLKSLILGTCEMAMAGAEIPEEIEKLAAENKVELTSAPIYMDAVVVVVNKNNPIKGISMKDLRDVFRGAITSWKQLGGKDVPINVISHPAASSTFEVFKRSVLGDDAVITPKATITTSLSEFEAAVNETAIGYASLHYTGDLKILPIGGVEANTETIKSGQYPVRRTLHLYQRKPESTIGKSVLEYFLAPDKGQRIVRDEMHDVPIK